MDDPRTKQHASPFQDHLQPPHQALPREPHIDDASQNRLGVDLLRLGERRVSWFDDDNITIHDEFDSGRLDPQQGGEHLGERVGGVPEFCCHGLTGLLLMV